MNRTSNAFTLAEVMLVLSVIGVIAALTIPGLIQNTQEKQLKVAWKKIYSDLSQNVTMLLTENNGDLVGVFSSGPDMRNKMTNNFNVLRTCDDSITPGNCWHKKNQWKYLNGTLESAWYDPGMVTGNGAFYIFYLNDKNCNDGTKGDVCGMLHADVNGLKGPNTVGKDIFAAKITRSGIRPFGAFDSSPPETTCIDGSTATTNTGYGCSTNALIK